MESRKYQLQKQIIEALKANDNDLYSLLKSQWAHRFGVDSLEELKSLDLEQLNQTPNNVDNQKIEQLKETSIKVDDNQSKEIIKKEVDEAVKDENDKSFTITSYSIAEKENNEDKTINPYKDSRSQPEIKALIPLPPRPKYSYLKKWLLRK